MDWLAYFLYPICALILIVMWLRVRGMSLEQIVQDSADSHHRINNVFKIHAHGGSWNEFESWFIAQADSNPTNSDENNS